MVSLLLLIMSFLGFNLLLVDKFKFRGVEAPFVANSFIILILYYCSLFGVLLQSLYIILYLGALIFAISIYQNQLKINFEFFYAICFFSLIIYFCSSWTEYFQFTAWDEFSHWALIVKHLYIFDSLPSKSSSILFLAYPPATALFQYYFTKSLWWSEGIILFSHIYLLSSAILAALSCIGRNYLLISTGFILCTISIYIFGYDIYEIYVDTFLSILLSLTACRIISRTQTVNNTAIIFLCLALLPIVKHVGLLFSLVGLCLFIFISISKISSPINYQTNLYKPLLFLSLYSFAALSSYISWKIHYTNIGVSTTYSNVIDPSNIYTFFVNPTLDKHILIWNELKMHMFNNITEHGYSILSPFTNLLLLFILSIFLIFISKKRDRYLMIIGFLVIILGLAGYVSFLLLAYAFYFADYEAIHLLSFERYYYSYLLFWAMFLIINYLNLLCDYMKSKSIIISQVILIFTYLIFIINKDTALMLAVRSDKIFYTTADQAFGEPRHLAEFLTPYLNNNAKVYFVDQNDNGFSFLMFKYYLYPHKTNEKNCWAFGSSGEVNTQYSCPLGFFEAIQNYNYLAIFHSDLYLKKATSKPSKVFQINSNSIYRIEKIGNELFFGNLHFQ